MKPIKIDVQKFQKNSFEFETKASKTSLSEIFSDRNRDINEINLFIAHFNTIPNYFNEVELNCEKAHL